MSQNLSSAAVVIGALRAKHLKRTSRLSIYSAEQACLVILYAFVSSTFFFSKLTFSKNSSRNTVKVSISLDPDPLWEPNLGQN